MSYLDADTGGIKGRGSFVSLRGRTTIKAQALADFIAELSTSEPSPTKSKVTP
ncbi:hypothetical protein AXF42_Ash005861 [Apostasia shenzhenica]|uniref:Uncharacterized protein n=1 Tax=Apostasia shenzhenica TaxID=1088818 RepID=A0A2I0BCL7_9ASPA|nr:hypothetical protein AXF42_Ash005861 [Apostasia shenzhenica]